MTCNSDFDDEECHRDAVVDGKAYHTKQGGRVEVWMEDIVQLASRLRIDKAGIPLLQMLLS